VTKKRLACAWPRGGGRQAHQFGSPHFKKKHKRGEEGRRWRSISHAAEKGIRDHETKKHKKKRSIEKMREGHGVEMTLIP